MVYGRDPNLPLHQLLEPMQRFLGDPDSGKLHLETPTFQIKDRVYFKNKQPGKWDLEVETWIPYCPYRVQWTSHPYQKPGYRKNTSLQHQRYNS